MLSLSFRVGNLFLNILGEKRFKAIATSVSSLNRKLIEDIERSSRFLNLKKAKISKYILILDRFMNYFFIGCKE